MPHTDFPVCPRSLSHQQQSEDTPIMRSLALALLTLILVPASWAQERTASGAIETQMSWTALSAKTDAAKLAAEAVNIRVNQVAICGRKGLLYGPGDPTRDGDGCVKPFVDDTAMNQLNAKINNVISCASQGRVFNGNNCVTTVANTPRLQCRVVSNSAGSAPHYVSRAECNSDEIMTGGGGQSETEGATNLCRGIGSSYIHSTVASGNGWAVDAYRPEGGEACTLAQAICCKIVN
jgi:hypothetical protein